MMPRRPVQFIPDVPLLLIPHVVLKAIRKLGEEIERIIIRKDSQHFYQVSIRSRSLHRELRPDPGRAGTPAACTGRDSR
jgi:hypothetical protein